MKKNFNWMLTSCRACSRSTKRASSLSARSIAAFAAILLSGQIMLTSCEKYVEATVDGLFKPLNDVADEYKEEKAQEMQDNLFNWRIGSTTDQASIDKYGYDNCFQVVSLTPDFWTGYYAPDLSPVYDKDQLCLVRCLSHSQYGILVGGIVCNQRIANDLVAIFRQLYESDYRIDRPCTASGYCKENLAFDNCTYSYFYDERNPESATTQQQQGLCIVVNAATPLTFDDAAVFLFKGKGFKWGGDEPGGDPNYFEK